MRKARRQEAPFRIWNTNRYLLTVISCLIPGIHFIVVFLSLRLYLAACGCFIVFALFLALYHKPLINRKFNAVFRGILCYAYILELIAAYCLEWEMGFQNLLFALIPLCFSYLYMDNNYEQIIPRGIRYSLLVVLCYLLCSVIDFVAKPQSGTTPIEIRFISGITSILTIGMTFAYMVMFVGELRAAHGQLMEENNARLEGLRSSMMLSQIKPHFLYNTIGAIEEMIDTNPARAKRELDGFARYMRMNIDTLSSQELVFFEKELSHVKAYVQIQNLRFGDTLSVTYDITSTNFRLPPLTIQPIVENAIKHGIRPRDGNGSIKLIESESADNYIIRVIDDGVGFEINEPIKAFGSTGLANIHYRLQKLCNGSVEMTSAPGVGTTVTVIIPKSNE